MRAMRFILNRFFRFWALLLVMLGIHIAMLAAVMIFHADLSGDDASDYLICKLFALIPMTFAVLLHMLFLSAQTTGCRLVRSMPMAAVLYTKAMPALLVAVTLCYALLTVIPYSVFIFVTERELCNISDMLIMTAIQCLYLNISGSVILSVNSMTTAFVAAYFLPMIFFGAAGFFIDWGSSLGVPLWGAVLIFVGAFAVGGAVSAIICRIMYYKSDFKERTTPQIYKGSTE